MSEKKPLWFLREQIQLSKRLVQSGVDMLCLFCIAGWLCYRDGSLLVFFGIFGLFWGVKIAINMYLKRHEAKAESNRQINYDIIDMLLSAKRKAKESK